MNTLFLDGIEPCDPTYRYIRDDPRATKEKAFVERLWGFFSPYADRTFRSDIATSFHPKFWEMYLAFGLAKQGAKLQPISSGGRSRKGGRRGPDLLLSGLPQSVWVEATVPVDGDGADRVPEECLGSAQDIPSDALILRYRTRIHEKSQKLCGYLEAGIVQDSDPYIIAINSRSLSFSLYESTYPRILHALFPLGDQFVTFDPRTKQVVESGYRYRAEIVKQSGEPVSTDVFLDPTYEGISAVLFCPSDVWHRPPNEAEVGLGDFMLIHNPMAKNKLPYQWLKCGRECWAEDSQLIIKNWYKEHPSYVKETEAGSTLGELIRKHQARRRIKQGDRRPAARKKKRRYDHSSPLALAAPHPGLADGRRAAHPWTMAATFAAATIACAPRVEGPHKT